MLNDKAKAVTSLSSSQLKQVAGKHSSEIAKILGPGHETSSPFPKTSFFSITKEKIDNFPQIINNHLIIADVAELADARDSKSRRVHPR